MMCTVERKENVSEGNRFQSMEQILLCSISNKKYTFPTHTLIIVCVTALLA